MVDELVARARATAPTALGIYVFGSYARGDATAASDLDVRVVARDPAQTRYLTWFVGDLHVSLGINSVEQMQERAATPASWSLGFPVRTSATWIWSTEAAVALLGDPPVLTQPADPAELEDFVEACVKALRADDTLTLRVAARSAGEFAPPLLRELNPAVSVETPLEAVRAAVSFTTAPEGWSHDLPILLGLGPADDSAVTEAAARVARGLLRLLRERRSPVGDRQPELTRYLLDGTLERLLEVA